MPLTIEEQDYLKNRAPLTFASDSNAPPFAFLEGDTKQYSGLVLDYVRALSIQLGTDIQFIPMTWEEAVKSVVDKKADMCDMFPSKERKRSMIFSNAIYEIRGIALVNKNSKITGISTLDEELVIAIPSGDYGIEYIQNHNYKVKIVEIGNIREGIKLLLDGKVNMVIGDEPVILHQINDMNVNGAVEVLPEVLYEQDVCIAIHPQNKILKTIMDKGILQLKRSHYIEKIQQKWFGLSATISKNKIPTNLLTTVLVLIQLLILGIIGFILWTSTLKNKIDERTAELTRSRNDLINMLNSLDDAIAVVLDDEELLNANDAFKQLFNKKGDTHLKSILDSGKESDEFIHQGRYYVYKVINMEQEKGAKLLSIKDITDIKSSQVQLIQQNKMIAIGQLASGVAHEIRNPLGIIRNYNYLLESRLKGKDSVIDKSIIYINNAVERAGSIVDELLNYTRVSEDKKCLINIKGQIESVLTLESATLKMNNVIATFDCGEDLNIKMHRYSLHHILLNLIDNSIDAMPEGGEINIICTNKKKAIEIVFSDTGEGISKESLENIFHPFYTTKNVGKGIGLGMYIVYNEVRKNGGEIRVESQLDKGTTFFMEFPIKEEILNAGI
ncbi:ATP-binding protein [Alkaliphilus oremlandii]|uniref:ATP-binding protein n=1 Tax=Alkaliphilus oremlandii TaxID=461876 RepID=UPI0000D8255B|nr:transporter substrate-binding domain-containing protein [Alkaliphilus oremlandii]